MAKDKSPSTIIAAINRLPIRDQAAWRILLFASPTALPDDPRETVRRAYALGDAYLDVARESWPGRKAEADAGDTEPADDAEWGTKQSRSLVA